MSDLYFQNREISKLNDILHEVQSFNIIPKWYWSMVSKLDFDQLAHGIKIKNDRLLDLVQNYTLYGINKEINLLKCYPKFMRYYKDYKVKKSNIKLDKSKVISIIGLEQPKRINNPLDKNVSQSDQKEYTGCILILGSHKGKKKQKLQEIAKENNYIGDIEFGPDYEELNTIGIAKYENSDKYDCIFIADSPHSAKGIAGKSSILKTLKGNSFPPSIDLRAKNGKLYLTANSFKEGILKARKHLEVVNDKIHTKL